MYIIILDEEIKNSDTLKSDKENFAENLENNVHFEFG
jgi:hypothetical protein